MQHEIRNPPPNLFLTLEIKLLLCSSNLHIIRTVYYGPQKIKSYQQTRLPLNLKIPPKMPEEQVLPTPQKVCTLHLSKLTVRQQLLSLKLQTVAKRITDMPCVSHEEDMHLAGSREGQVTPPPQIKAETLGSEWKEVQILRTSIHPAKA